MLEQLEQAAEAIDDAIAHLSNIADADIQAVVRQLKDAGMSVGVTINLLTAENLRERSEALREAIREGAL